MPQPLKKLPLQGQHQVTHTCGHTVTYVAVPLKLSIALFGEQIAYRDAIHEHSNEVTGQPCEDCQP